MAKEKLSIHAVILAGGRGTRFWPRSRTRTPKQLLNIVGKSTMLEQTVARLHPLIPPDHIWTVTNAEQADPLKKQLPAAARKHVLTEPVGRNTAAAIALAAFHIQRAAHGDALMAVLPADTYIAQPERYRFILKSALRVAEQPGRIVVLGIPPTRPETGFGYIERINDPIATNGTPVYPVHRFTEKPDLDLAKEYVRSGEYHWNAGMFFWRVSTFLDALKSHLPKTFEALHALAQQIGKPGYASKLKKIYTKLENISVDYAILERSTALPGPPRVYVIPAEVGWSDIGSWTAVHELQARDSRDNVFVGEGEALDTDGSFFWSPKKFVAAIGVHDLVVVDTPDALLICPRDRAQDVGKIVKSLEAKRRKHLL
ncbi:MAG TPA: mannose-1-phosphate guanylyltransferase [Candidatus Acidoferrum sp.]